MVSLIPSADMSLWGLGSWHCTGSIIAYLQPR